jgi:nucleoside-diphosphate-sugar epimerase
LIIGNGLIASALEGTESAGQVIFASGVSNSIETDPEKFDRERYLLKSSMLKFSEKTIYYISTCSVYDSSLANSPYIRHKLLMEHFVLSQNNGQVVRLPNVVGPSGNPNNLVNFFASKIRNGEPFSIQEDARRFLLGVDEMRILVSEHLKSTKSYKSPLNICPPESTSALEIVLNLEEILSMKALKSIITGGSSYSIPNADSMELAAKVGIDFEKDYAMSVLRKWFSND